MSSPPHSSPTAALIIALIALTAVIKEGGRREYHIISDSDTLLTERVLVALVPLK